MSASKEIVPSVNGKIEIRLTQPSLLINSTQACDLLDFNPVESESSEAYLPYSENDTENNPVQTEINPGAPGHGELSQSNDDACGVKISVSVLNNFDFNDDGSTFPQSEELAQSSEITPIQDDDSSILDFNDIPECGQTDKQTSVDEARLAQSLQDSLAEALRRMQKHGLIVSRSDLIIDGKIHRCGTVGKKKGKDGAYVIRIFPHCVIARWWNWRTSGPETQKYQSKPSPKLSPEEKQEVLDHISSVESEAQKMREEVQQLAIKRAKKLWDLYKEVPDDHPYLKRKGIKSYGLKYDAKRKALVIPILDDNGNIQGLECIHAHNLPDGTNKRFFPGGRVKGGYFLIPPATGHENDAILISEGYATGASLHEATGCEVWIAFSASNLLDVAGLASKRFHKARNILICADWDVHCDQFPNEGGTGVYYGSLAAASIGSHCVICPCLENGKGDFNDLHQARGLDAVKKIIDDALAEVSKGVIDTVPKQYFYKGDALYYQPLPKKTGGKTPLPIYICRKLKIIGYCRDRASEKWGLYLEWHDPDEKIHRKIVLKSELVGQSRYKTLASLQGGGLSMGEKHECGELLCDFFRGYETDRRVITTVRTGWLGNNFVTPDGVFGPLPNNERIILDHPYDKSLYHKMGSYEAWKKIPGLCVGNIKLEFAICASFAPVLLYLANMEAGGFNFYGPSSSSKTTLLFVIGSVWGGPSHVLSWRTTANAMEKWASLLSDCCLLLDELGQGDVSEIFKLIYSLANGRGKERMNNDIQLRETLTWLILLFSTGENKFEDLLRKIGEKMQAGQQVRLSDIPIEKSDISDLHGYQNAGEMVREIKKLSSDHYGHAGREFLTHLTSPGTLECVRNNMDADLNEIVSIICDQNSDGQVQRVARRFALVAIAGKLAIEFGILPDAIKPLKAVNVCFSAWLEARGGSGPLEDIQILSQMRRYLEAHALDRFYDQRTNDEGYPTPVNNMSGFKQKDKGEFYIFPEAFKEIMAGFSEQRALKILFEAGWLIKQDQKRFKSRFTFSKFGQIQVYHIIIPDWVCGHTTQE